MLGETVSRKTNCDAKALLLITLLLGFAAILSLPYALNKDDSVMAMISAPSASMRSMRGGQLPWAQRTPMRAQQPVQRVSALPSSTEPDYSMDPITDMESQVEPSSALEGRRDMMARAAAALGLAAAATQGEAALADDGAKKSDGRLGLLVIAPTTAVGWVLFNMLGPGSNQLDGMSAKAASRAPKKTAFRAKAAPAKKAAPKKKSLFR